MGEVSDVPESQPQQNQAADNRQTSPDQSAQSLEPQFGNQGIQPSQNLSSLDNSLRSESTNASSLQGNDNLSPQATETDANTLDFVGSLLSEPTSMNKNLNLQATEADANTLDFAESLLSEPSTKNENLGPQATETDANTLDFAESLLSKSSTGRQTDTAPVLENPLLPSESLKPTAEELLNEWSQRTPDLQSWDFNKLMDSIEVIERTNPKSSEDSTNRELALRDLLTQVERLEKFDKIAQAVEKVSDPKQQLIEMAKMVDSITPISERPGFYTMKVDNELIELQTFEVDQQRERIRENIINSASDVSYAALTAYNNFDQRMKKNEGGLLTQWAARQVHFWGDITPPDPKDISNQLQGILSYSLKVQEFAEAGEYEKAARQFSYETQYVEKLVKQIDDYEGDVISTAGTLVKVAQVTKTLSDVALVVMSMGAATLGKAALAKASFIAFAAPTAEEGAQQAVEVNLGRRGEIDWGSATVKGLVAYATSRMGGPLASKLYSKLAGAGVAGISSVGRRAFARITTNLLIDRAATVMQISAESIYGAAKRNGDNIDQVLDRFADALFSDKALVEMAMGVAMGEVGHRVSLRQQAGMGGEPVPTAEPTKPMSTAKPSKTAASVPEVVKPEKKFTAEEKAVSKNLEAKMAADKETVAMAELAKDAPDLHKEVISNKTSMGDSKTTLKDLAQENPQMLKDMYARWKEGVLDGEIKTKDFGEYVKGRQSEFRGRSGELQDAFNRGPNEIMVKAPKAKVNESGTDSISYNTQTNRIKLLDNKSVKTDATVSEVSALEKNLPKNLRDDIAEIKKFVGNPGVPKEIGDKVLPRLEAAKTEIDAYILKNKLTPEQLRSTSVQKDFAQILNKHGIDRVVTSEGSGQRTGISSTLSGPKDFKME